MREALPNLSTLRIVAVATLNAGAVVVLGLARQGWPSEQFWRNNEPWVIVALLVSASVPLVQAIIMERGERARRKAIEREQKIQLFLTTSLIYIVRHAGADWETTGIQAFEIRRRWKWGATYHQKAAVVRLAPIPPSGIKWTEGKGLIGRCWKTRTRQFTDLAAHFSDVQHLGPEDWRNLSDEKRYGLTFDDFQRVRGKYGIVAAVPIISRKEKYVGCITSDMPPGRDIAKRPVLESLATTAQLVREVL